MIHFHYQKCTNCRFPISFQLFSASTDLGPELIICRKCKEPIYSGRQEWFDFTLKQKGKFFFICALYFLFGWYGLGLAFYKSIEAMKGNVIDSDLFWETDDFTHYKWWGVGIIAAILITKLGHSLASAVPVGEEKRPSTESLLTPNFTFGAHLKVMILLLLFYGCVDIIGRLQ